MPNPNGNTFITSLPLWHLVKMLLLQEKYDFRFNGKKSKLGYSIVKTNWYGWRRRVSKYRSKALTKVTKDALEIPSTPGADFLNTLA